MQSVISTFHLSAFVSLRSHTTTCCLRKDSTISFPEILLPGKDSVLNGLSDQFIASRWLQRRNDGFVFAGYPLLGGKPSGNHLGKSLTDSRAAFEVGTPLRRTIQDSCLRRGKNGPSIGHVFHRRFSVARWWQGHATRQTPSYRRSHRRPAEARSACRRRETGRSSTD